MPLFNFCSCKPIYEIERLGEKMKSKSISVIKQLMASNKLTKEAISELKSDERIGIQQLLKSYKQQQEHKQKLARQYEQMLYYERAAYENGVQLIAGVDEAGRGPIAGPVVAAAVILPREINLVGLTDSKQLTKKAREEFFHKIKEEAICYGIGSVSSKEIDEVNIYEATKMAMKRAIMLLDPTPEHVLIDAVDLDSLPYSSQVITKGDQKSIAIAAASVLAKVTRDVMMGDLAKNFPQYGFESHKGYGTKEHVKMLEKYGPTPYHRHSFAPVRKHNS